MQTNLQYSATNQAFYLADGTYVQFDVHGHPVTIACGSANLEPTLTTLKSNIFLEVDGDVTVPMHMHMATDSSIKMRGVPVALKCASQLPTDLQPIDTQQIMQKVTNTNKPKNHTWLWVALIAAAVILLVVAKKKKSATDKPCPYKTQSTPVVINMTQ